MQGFGEILRGARETKLIDLEKASRETNISRRYIEALETEQLTLFPGEPYLLGFLRNYAEYLELNPSEMVSIYRKIMLQQSAIPDVLLAPRKKFPFLPVLSSVVAVGLIGYGVFFVVEKQKEKQAFAAKSAASAIEPAVYVLTDIPLQVTLRSGDTLQIPGQNASTDLKVMNTVSSVSLQTPVGILMIEQGEEIGLDIDGVPGAELTVYVGRVSKNDASEGADVRMFLPRPATKPAQTTIITQDIPAGSTVAGSARRLTIFEGNTAYPFTLSATFRGACLLRYQSDRNQTVEELYSSGDTLLVQANNGIRVWASNANAVKFQVIGGGKTIDMEPGRSGQVIVQDVRWLRDEDGKFRLVCIDVE